MNKPNETKREKNTGKYTYTLDRVCACGHTLGNHTAIKTKGAQPCVIGDFEDVSCDCECFKPAKE